MPHLSPTALIFLLMGGLFAIPPAAAQPSPDSIRAAALHDYHGPDGKGKDGPLAKVGQNLLLLYHEYRAFQEQEADTAFTPRRAEARVKDGHVAVEAVATDTADELLADLKALGLRNGVTGGRLVSGWLPIEQIPEMAQLESLRGLMQSTMETRTQKAPSRTPSQLSPGAPAPAPRQEGSSSSAPASDSAGLFLLVLSGLLLGLEA